MTNRFRFLPICGADDLQPFAAKRASIMLSTSFRSSSLIAVTLGGEDQGERDRRIHAHYEAPSSLRNRHH